VVVALLLYLVLPGVFPRRPLLLLPPRLLVVVSVKGGQRIFGFGLVVFFRPLLPLLPT